MDMDKIFMDGICPVCGGHMAGTSIESMKCESCGQEKAIYREDVEAMLAMIENLRKKEEGKTDA